MTTKTPGMDAYDWYADRYQSVFVSRNRWLVTAILSLSLAALQALALVCMVPLKTSVPYVIKEEVSGVITAVRPLTGDASVTFQESTKKYFLARYVIARETYDPAYLSEDSRIVELLSDPEEARDFNRLTARTNPRSPAAIYGQRIQRSIRIKSISFLNERMAQVRLTATENNKSGMESVREWVAWVSFMFGPAPALESDRLINPLGFLVTNYRLDQEVVP